MKKLRYKKEINAPAAKVYKTMLGLDSIETYNQWTAEFNPTSTYKGSWEKGSKILFIGTDESGKQGGMVSEIADNIPNEFVSIRHYGILDGEKEVTEGPEVEKWAGGLENYSFDEHNGVTTVTVETDTIEDFMDYFNSTWPNALNKLKEIVEN
ncbi:MAG: SRPBCC domain-containing protein [Flavobacteriales bacterium]